MILSGIPLDEIQPKVRKFTTKGVCKYWLFNNWMVSITKYEYARDFLSEPANPAFNRALSPEVVGKITIDLMNLLDKLVDQPFDIFKVMQRTTIQVLGKIAFSYDFKCLENLETRHDLIETYIKLLRSLRNPIAFILPWLTAEKEGYEISSNDLRDELVTFFLAGHDTTSHALSVVFYYIAKYPIQNKAREEAFSVLGVKGKIPTSEDLKKLKYINAIIKESLRLYPSLAITIPRLNDKELSYGQIIIPKNTRTNVNIWAIHHDPENWSDPDIFIPERFLSNENGDNLHAWMPFSSGSRNCIGQNFSLMEQRTIISMLLLNYEISLPQKSPHKDKIVLTSGSLISPKNLDLIFSKRK
ncbi:17068_t:CDS:10 [Entrophospora sp. SA101]|nr:910_t:CDS:10 [Entrophospora sp. SA101]CAJ0826257.1 17068_t:CDS:10 [Entrophospora sp. SA101]CAJ0860319.1 7459_t:CDS:10 [Entrophospora sp. SA101]